MIDHPLTTILFSVLSIAGIWKIVEVLLNRFFFVRDSSKLLHETNQEHTLNAESKFRSDLLARLNHLEVEHNSMKETILQQAVENKELSIENKFLKSQTEKQEEELERLRVENLDQKGQINRLKEELRTLRSELNHTIQEVHLLKSQLNAQQKGEGRSGSGIKRA